MLGRDTRRYRRLRRELFATKPPCHLCGYDIDYTAPARSRWAPTLDHRIPLSLGGSPEDPANLVPAHYGCNSSRGNGQRRRPHNPVSRPW